MAAEAKVHLRILLSVTAFKHIVVISKFGCRVLFWFAKRVFKKLPLHGCCCCRVGLKKERKKIQSF